MIHRGRCIRPRAIAKGIGALFLRSYERGERVYQAMLSRGFDGKAPDLAVIGAPPRAAAMQWAIAMITRRRSGDGVGARVGDAMTAIRIEALRHVYPDGQVALDGVDLTVAPGERIAVLGPNGAGKTTLMLHLNGVLTATTGSVQISGIPMSRKNLQDIRRRVGLVFQDPDDQLFMPTVAQDVAFGPANFGLRGDALAARVRQALDTVSLADQADRSPTHLSAGQRRRAALATVLACEPEILVLDEPSANLDPVARRELAETLSGTRRHHAARHARPALRGATMRPGGGHGRWGHRRRRRDRSHPLGRGIACGASARAAVGIPSSLAGKAQCRLDGGHGGSPHSASSAFSITSGSAGWIQY